MKRYKIYYKLVDATFAALGLVFLLSSAQKIFDFRLFPLSSTWSFIFTITHLTLMGAALFLTFARFLQDEYARQIWKDVTSVLAYILLGLPFVVFIACIIMPDIFLPLLAKAVIPPPHHDDIPMAPEVHGAIRLISIQCYFMPILFLTAFQWHRWRDGRG